MADSSSAYIGVLLALLGILVILTVAAAVVLWYRKKYVPLKRRKSYKDKKPKLKLDIKSIPRTKPEPPSAAYHILSSNEPPEFIIPPTPKTLVPPTPQYSYAEPPDFFIPSSSNPSTPRSSAPQTPLSITPGQSPPLTPETPGFILHSPPKGGILGGAFKRQTSIPAEYVHRERISERSPGALWRSALEKTATSSLLVAPQRKIKKISFCPNGKIKFTIRHNSATTELFVKVRIV